MSIDSIVADERVIMTDTLIRAFRIEDCEPACHCCYEEIISGDYFKLAEIDGKDEMLCDSCTPKRLRARRTRTRNKVLLNPSIGFTRKHLIG